MNPINNPIGGNKLIEDLSNELNISIIIITLHNFNYTAHTSLYTHFKSGNAITPISY